MVLLFVPKKSRKKIYIIVGKIGTEMELFCYGLNLVSAYTSGIGKNRPLWSIVRKRQKGIGISEKGTKFGGSKKLPPIFACFCLTHL